MSSIIDRAEFIRLTSSTIAGFYVGRLRQGVCAECGGRGNGFGFRTERVADHPS
ncbi:MAG: hypothetical protein ACXVAM_18065 [Vulcanimicrobiaceae bacterium]